jgi:dihydrofolate reductase/thymidylate synthase
MILKSMKDINIILAASLQKTGELGIGNNSCIPWDVPEDLEFFREKTIGNVVIMGRKTFDSIGKVLYGRENVILSGDPLLDIPGATVVHNYLELDDFIRDTSKKVFIIGGSSLYNRYLPIAKCIYLTEIKQHFICDTVINGIPSVFRITNFSDTKESNGIKYRFIQYEIASFSYETQYISLIKDILQNGVPKTDRTGTGTLSKFGIQHRYDISNGNIPLLTTKRIPFKSVVEELLWFCRGDTDSKILDAKGVKIWNANTSQEFLNSRNLNYITGQAGPIYGWQWRKFNAKFPEGTGGIDQLANVEFLLKNDPFSRRIMISSWNPSQLNEMALPPCHFCIMFYVEEIDSVKYLSGHYVMRSNDIILGNPWNIACYSILTQILAKKCGMVAKELVATVNDAHIYSNHIESANKQLNVKIKAPPVLKISDDIIEADWETMTTDHFELIGYFPSPRILAKMAV